jgi:hypothetical protein
MSNVTIIGKGPKTQGTKVLVDGVAMKGVTRVELVADVNSLWKAVIHVIAKEVDITDMDSTEIEYVRTHKNYSLPHSVTDDERLERLGKRIEAGDPELFEEVDLEVTNIDSDKPESVRAQVFKHSQ